MSVVCGTANPQPPSPSMWILSGLSVLVAESSPAAELNPGWRVTRGALRKILGLNSSAHREIAQLLTGPSSLAPVEPPLNNVSVLSTASHLHTVTLASVI